MTRQEAARLNGPKSRGPITPEGKAISSRNATTHGLFAKTIIPNVVLDNEAGEVFDELLQASMETYAPSNRLESEDVVTFASCFWRHRRAFELETAAVNANLNDDPKITEGFRTLLAFAKCHQDSAFFANLPLYETRLQRAVEKARKRLDNMLERRDVRKADGLPGQAGDAKLTPGGAQLPGKNEPVATVPQTGQIARSAPCPCGSGAKFKRCCGPLAPPAPGSKAA